MNEALIYNNRKNNINNIEDSVHFGVSQGISIWKVYYIEASYCFVLALGLDDRFTVVFDKLQILKYILHVSNIFKLFKFFFKKKR